MPAILLSLSFISSAQAAIVCDGTTRFGTALKVTLVDGQTAHVSVLAQDGSSQLEQDFDKLDDVWDGHMTGLMTAPGLSVKYENQFGCIRNVVITTNVRGGGIGFIDTVTVKACRGGTTRDELCVRP